MPRSLHRRADAKPDEMSRQKILSDTTLEAVARALALDCCAPAPDDATRQRSRLECPPPHAVSDLSVVKQGLSLAILGFASRSAASHFAARSAKGGRFLAERAKAGRFLPEWARAGHVPPG
jgi:hypothetical protein